MTVHSLSHAESARLAVARTGSADQDTSASRLTATASDEAYIGSGWTPVTGLSATEAKALAAFINSTPGRLQLM